MTFICNLCGAVNPRPEQAPGREVPSCAQCGSTVRLRSLVALLSQELFGVGLALPDFPRAKSVRGIGMSDPPELAARLEPKLDYANTFYHQAPRFDVTNPAAEDAGRYDFILSSEVMEHVPAPVEQAFANLCGLLKPDGFLLLTVPYRLESGVDEHFPELHDYSLARVGGKTVLVNRAKTGELQVFDNLCFHGGDGSTLELRVYSEQALVEILKNAGFAEVHIATESLPEFGVEHAEAWSLPVIARKASRRGPAEELAGAYRELAAEKALLKRELATVQAEYERHIAFHKESQASMEQQLAERAAWVKKVEADFAQRTEWAMTLDGEKQALEAEVARLMGSEAEAWRKAADLERAHGDLRVDRTRVEGRLWTRIGRRLGLVK